MCRYGVVAKTWRIVTTAPELMKLCEWGGCWRRFEPTAMYNEDVFGVKAISCKWRCVAVIAMTHQFLFYPVAFLWAVLWCGVFSVNYGYREQLMHNKSDHKTIVALNFTPQWLLSVVFCILIKLLNRSIRGVNLELQGLNLMDGFCVWGR